MKKLVFRELIEFEIQHLRRGADGVVVRAPPEKVRREVEVTVDLPAIVKRMGKRACLNATRKCVDGYVTVRQVKPAQGDEE